MPAVAWVIGGALLGVIHLMLSQRLLHAVVGENSRESASYPRWYFVLGALFGAATVGVITGEVATKHVVPLLLVTSLMLIQAPFDLVTHRLSRAATMVGLLIAAILWMTELVSSTQSVTFTALLSIGSVVATYWLLRRVSPHSLGWGDVLLVVPLTLAIAYVSVERVLWWQLVAASTGAMHAGWVRVRHGRRHIPFGPHLLLGAWMVLVTGV